jgi:hypothetical protein
MLCCAAVFGWQMHGVLCVQWRNWQLHPGLTCVCVRWYRSKVARSVGCHWAGGDGMEVSLLEGEAIVPNGSSLQKRYLHAIHSGLFVTCTLQGPFGLGKPIAHVMYTCRSREQQQAGSIVLAALPRLVLLLCHRVKVRMTGCW